MKKVFNPNNRGSALLIVLSLLSFLMISAVAFSISMRTERTAASAYRRGLMARELLENAFADARATLESSLRDQQSGFNPDDPNTRTVENLAPFKYPNQDRYGRVMTSVGVSGDSDIAYLLDESVMAHVPPYVAYPVYESLEFGDSIQGSGYQDSNSTTPYGLDGAAGWKKVVVSIPEVDMEDQVSGVNMQEAVVGRMAWAIVNLSDSLDLNAVGSVSPERGIGLTANEFAYFDGVPDGAESESYQLLKAGALDLPIFCSNADITRFAAKVNGSSLNTDSRAYAWQDAVMEEGDGFYSPFSCYSFWPDAARINETSERRSSGAQDAVSCDVVNSAYVKNGDLFKNAASGIDKNTLNRFLYDYLDEDAIPSDLGVTNEPDRNTALPTVENVPMVSEVAYQCVEVKKDDIEEMLEKALEDLGKELKKQEVRFPQNQVPTSIDKGEFKFAYPKAGLKIEARTYFPGHELSKDPEAFKTEISGFVGALANLRVGDTDVEPKGDVRVTVDDISDDTGVSQPPDGKPFADVEKMDFELPENELEWEWKLEEKALPVVCELPDGNMGQSPENAEVTLAVLVDYYFRVAVKDGSDVVDYAPASTRGEFETRYYAESFKDRKDKGAMAGLDMKAFRVSVPMSVTFKIKMVLDEDENENGVTEYTVEELLVDGDVKIEWGWDKEIELHSDLKLAKAGDTGSLRSFEVASPEKGSWYTIDPRYNWLSPMMGLTDEDASAYGTSANILAAFSSPHWLFTATSDGKVEADSNGASRLQKDYQDQNAEIVPFKWGVKVDDVRYGYNDSDQLLLPGEVGFLPLPLKSSVLSPNEQDYRRNSIQSYYDSVAKASFFRTIPLQDLEDNAMTASVSYEDCYKLRMDALTSFSGASCPEEHRGLVNVFTAQDNYYLAQQLRQFALLGMPSSITQAALNTKKRLSEAEDTKRVLPKMLDVITGLKVPSGDDQSSNTEATKKFNTFVTKYLFPIPDSPTDAEWPENERPQSLENFLGMGGSSGSSDSSQPGSGSFVDRMVQYNQTEQDKMGQNDMTLLLSMARECFGDRQQLFLFILRTDAIAYNAGRDLSKFRPLSTARAVALVWRDAYGELPDRIIYYQVLP